MTTTQQHLESLIAPVAESLGYELVRVRLMGGKSVRVQVMAEKPDGTMDVEDCATLSRALSEMLDAADPIASEYTLEVSSPGIDRPLTRAKDFVTWAGHEAKIEMMPGAGTRRRWRGVLKGLESGEVLIELAPAKKGETPEIVRLPAGLIEDARLVLTDELIAEDLKRRRLADKNLAWSETAPPEGAPKPKPVKPKAKNASPKEKSHGRQRQ